MDFQYGFDVDQYGEDDALIRTYSWTDLHTIVRKSKPVQSENPQYSGYCEYGDGLGFYNTKNAEGRELRIFLDVGHY